MYDHSALFLHVQLLVVSWENFLWPPNRESKKETTRTGTAASVGRLYNIVIHSCMGVFIAMRLKNNTNLADT